VDTAEASRSAVSFGSRRHSRAGSQTTEPTGSFIEVKRCTTRLNQRHLRQVETYAVNEGVEWLILTNGVVWQVYRIVPVMPISIDLVVEVDLLKAGSGKADKLYHLTKESMRRHQIDEIWRAAAATAPKALVEAILAEAPLDAIRKEIRRRSGHNADPSDLARFIRNTVLAPELRT
jgi:hypothetical protein